MRDTILATLARRAASHPHHEALRELASGGAPAERAMTWSEWHEAARAVAAVLVAEGFSPGDRVAVLAGNRLPWPVADVGIMLAGCVSVGIYPTSSASQLQALLADSGARALVVDEAGQLAKARRAREGHAALRLLVHDSGADVPDAVAWPAVLARGAALLATDPAIVAELAARAEAIAPDETAILIYTSGSTGSPKGARISHRTLVASAHSAREALGFVEGDTSLSFLPYSHAGERIFGMATRIECGMAAGLVADHARLWDAARDYRPTVFGGMPRFFEKLYEGLLTAEGAHPEWQAALAAGRMRSRLLREGLRVPDDVTARWHAGIAPVREWVAGWLGDRVRLVTSGGAALNVAVAESLDAAGVTVLGAYGLTEHLCCCFHRPHAYDFTGVGPAMPGTELRIADDGEVLVRRSDLTFSGYYGKPRETAEAFTADGAWLRTGDLGRLDARGILHLTGRKKELIALAAGKKVAPLAIEGRLVAEAWIAQAMCYGEGRKFLSALLTLRRPVVEQWALEQGVVGSWSTLLAHPLVQARLDEMVARVNAEVSGPEQVRRFVVLEHELTMDAGELTPTQKIRRDVVAERYQSRLDALYRNS